jgi:alpha-D-xyloside xylohydrolase
VLISKDSAKSLNLDNPEGKLVNYSGKAISINL